MVVAEPVQKQFRDHRLADFGMNGAFHLDSSWHHGWETFAALIAATKATTRPSTRLDRVRAWVGIAQLALQQIEDDLSAADVGQEELAAILRELMFANMADNALFTVLPTLAKQVLNNPLALGLSVAAFGAGALAGGPVRCSWASVPPARNPDRRVADFRGPEVFRHRCAARKWRCCPSAA
ncbi:hypothetical protein ACFU6I_11260 [Streptomyces sp. NPDC057486]|uniref:hypothetical protein n=1 Tax=Streptomyces sp. NPDC057486 TaxID=3346145 RepID=UPI0036AE2D3C